MTFEHLITLRDTVVKVGKIVAVEDGNRLVIEGVANKSFEDNGGACIDIVMVWNELPSVFEEIFRLNEDHVRLTNTVHDVHRKTESVLQNTSRAMVSADYWQADG